MAEADPIMKAKARMTLLKLRKSDNGSLKKQKVVVSEKLKALRGLTSENCLQSKLRQNYTAKNDVENNIENVFKSSINAR